MSHWWELFPGRLEAEREGYDQRGLDFELDEELFAKVGRVVFRGHIYWRARRLTSWVYSRPCSRTRT